MQSLDVISINVWHILISLCNLILLFWVVKKFLFKPVKNLMAARQAELDHQYAAAADAEQKAMESKNAWEQKLRGAEDEANAIITDATDLAKRRAEQIVTEAKVRADGIVSRAEEEAVLERKRATEDMKREIVGVSAAIAEKMLEREVKEEDHRAMIDSFIEQIGEES